MYVGGDYSRARLQFAGHEDFKMWMNNRRGLFPALHSLLAFAIYGVPILNGIQLGIDPSVLYWIGWHSWFVMLVPLLLVICHFFHAVKGRPQFNAMVMSTVVPALIVIAIGYSVMVPISGITDRLMSSDCTTYTDKTYLNDAYEAAAQIWESCLLRESNETGRSVKELKAQMVVDECLEYSENDVKQEGARNWAPQWRYLRSLEVNQDCSGWCNTAQESLWTTDHQSKDICSSIVASILNAKVRKVASRMLLSGLIALVVSLVALVAVQEYMIRLGVDW